MRTIRHGTLDPPIQEEEKWATQSTDLTMVLSTGTAIQCVITLFYWIMYYNIRNTSGTNLLKAASHHIPTGRHKLHEETGPVPAEILDVMTRRDDLRKRHPT